MRPSEILCVLLLTLAPAVPSRAQPLSLDFFGSIGYPYQGQLSWLDATLDGLYAGGIRSVRFPIFWSYQPQTSPPYFYTLYETNLMANAARARGMDVYAFLNIPDDSVRWTPPVIDPGIYQAYLRFVEDMAATWGDRIEFWEIGNELNQSLRDQFGYFPGWDFARLLRDARAALKRGFLRRSDYPALIVARGGEGFKMYPAGTAGSDLGWLRDLCQGLELLYTQYPSEGRYIDGFSIHPYSLPQGPDDRVFYNAPGWPNSLISQGTLVQNLEWVAFTLNSHCPRAPKSLFMGEYSWSTYYPANPAQTVTETQQGIFLAQGLLQAHASGRVASVLFGWRDSPYPNFPLWDHAGTLHEDASPKPAHIAAKNMADRLLGLTLKENLGWITPVGRMYLYGGTNRQTLVYWNPTTLPMTVKVTAGSTIRVYDHLGNLTQAPPAGATQVSVTIFPEPRYVEVTGGRITRVLGQSLDANGVPTLPGYSPVPTTWTRASSTLGGSPSGNAFDGSSGTGWNSGGVAPGWVEAKLYNLQNVRALILEPSMLPSGLVDHKIDLAINNGAYQQVAQVTSYLSDDMKVVVKLPQTYTNVSHVRVRSVARADGSPTWLAWREVRIYR